MKKIIKLISIILTLFFAINVNAKVNDTYTMVGYNSGTASSIIKWSMGTGVHNEKFEVQKDGTDKTYTAYCINAHANMLSPDSKQKLKEIVSIPGSTKEAQGYAAMYAKKDEFIKNNDESLFISALRVYTIIAYSQVATGMDGVKGDDYLDYESRKSVYYHYNQLAHDTCKYLKLDSSKYNCPKATYYYFKFSDNVNESLYKLVKTGIDTTNKTSTSSGTPTVTANYKEVSSNIIKYTINTAGVKDNKITNIKVDGASKVEICDSLYTNCSEIDNATNKKIYIKATFDDINDSICNNNKGTLTYKYDSNNSYTGAILERKSDETGYQKFIYLTPGSDSTGSFAPDTSFCNKCNSLSGLEKTCCDNPDAAECSCDSTKQDCVNKNNCNIDIDSDSKNCNKEINGTTIEYNEKNNNVYTCVLAKGDKNNNTYNYSESSVKNNKYCSVYCTEEYKFATPGKQSTKAGRYFNISVEVKTARQDCYLSTAQNFFEKDLTTYNDTIERALAQYNANYSAMQINCTGKTDEEGNSIEEECKNEYYSTLKELYNEIKESSSNLKTSISDYQKCIDFEELDYNFEPIISIDYDEPYKNLTKWADELTNKNLNKMVTSDNVTIKPEVYYCDSAKKLNDPAAEGCVSEKPGQSTLTYYTNCSINNYLNGESSSNLFSCTKDSFEKPVYTYVKRSNIVNTDSNITYTTPRVFYNSSITGEVSINANQPTPKEKYSLIDGLPVSYQTPAGEYNYSINIKNVGYFYDNYTEGNKGRIFGDNNAIVSTEKESTYVCTYNVVDDTACVKDSETFYICNSETYYKLKKATEDKYSSIISAAGSACHVADSQEAACATYDINCGNVGKKCKTVIKKIPPTSTDEPKAYEVSFRTITNGNVNPNNRKMGFNWNINSSNELVARKAIDTLNYITYRANEVAKTGIIHADLKTYGEKDTTFKVVLNSELIQKIRDYNDQNEKYNNDSLKCYDYINETINDETTCQEKAGYTWINGKCVLDNVFCYSTFINDLIESKEYEIDSGTRPETSNQGDISSKDFDNTSITDEIANLAYYPSTGSTAINTSVYSISTSYDKPKANYWTIYNYNSLDINNDGIADIGPSWR